MNLFADRIEAGMALAGALREHKHGNTLVLAIPRGGVTVAYIVARELELPLDIILTKKIGHPRNKEYAIGAIDLNGRFVGEHSEVSETYIKEESERIREKLHHMYHVYRGDASPPLLEGKIILLIDDGVATGNTLLAAVRSLRKDNVEKIIIAVPVSSPGAYKILSAEADDMVCLHVPDTFQGVGGFYEDFSQVEDQDVIHYLNEIHRLRGSVMKKA